MKYSISQVPTSQAFDIGVHISTKLLRHFVTFLADYVNKSDFKQRLTMMSGRSCSRKVQGCVPHDIGDPGKNNHFYVLKFASCLKNLFE